MNDTHQPHDKEAVPGILRDTLLNIFQITNPEFYSQSEEVTLEAATIQIARNLLEIAQSPFAAHFHEQSPAEDITLYFGAEPEGSFIMFLDYKLKGASGSDHRSAMIIGRKKQDENDADLNQVAPHFIMTGYNVPADDVEGDIFIPQEMVCRIHFDGDDYSRLVNASNDEGIVAAICYADEAFRTIAAGESVDMSANQDWLADDEMARAEVADRYLALKERTLASLKEELNITSPEAITKQAPQLPPGSFLIDGPSTYQ